MIYWTLFIVCLWSRSTSLKSSAHPSRVACLLLKNLDDDNGTKYTKAIGIEKVQKVGKELKAILEKLSNSEKYAMLLQSFRNRVLESRNATYRSEQFAMMRSLYSEMIQNSYRPEPSSATLFLDASSMMQDIYQMSFTCRIVKAGGSLKAFGASISQISAPIFSHTNSPLRAIALPLDNRQDEVLAASVAMSAVLFELGLQVCAVFDPEAHPWATLLGSVIVLTSVLDLSLRQGTGLRNAAAGVERLVLADEERKLHCDAASFLAGYLLGLPCFCFKPNVAESAKLLAENAQSLDAHLQPAAIRAQRSGRRAQGNYQNGKRSVLSRVMQQLTGTETGTATSTQFGQQGTADFLDKGLYDLCITADEEDGGYDNEVGVGHSKSRMALGRVLVWLMAPAAAEQLKYGKTVLSDPHLAKRLLDSMNVKRDSKKKFQLHKTTTATTVAASPSSLSATSSLVDSSDLPATLFTTEQDRTALLEWAYFEAVTLVRQNGDVLERVRQYMAARTSSVGETALMIDDLMC